VAAATALADDAVDCAAPMPAAVTLAAAEQRFAHCNRDVRAARVALAAAIADRIVAGQRPNPNLTLGASNINPHAGIGSGGPRDKTLDASVRIDQLIERGGKGTLRERQADSLVAAVRADLAEVLRQQRLAMRQAFFDLAAADERVRLQREFASLSRDSLSATDKRLAAGDIARVDANRIRLDALRAANDMRQAEIDRERARAEFARLIGAQGAAARMTVVPTWPEAALAARPAAGERPDIAAARRRVEASEAARDLARAIATRDVTLGLQADRWPVSDTNQLGTGISYTVSVSVPLHVRHANEGEARRAAADLEAARAQLARAQAQAAADALFAESDWQAARERRARVENDVLPAAREVAEGSEFAFTRGASGVLDLLDARRQLKAVEIDATQARADAAKAWARREAANETYAEEGP
jgi:cobalt-zinc-cadmium efflux system outer membrane protein